MLGGNTGLLADFVCTSVLPTVLLPNEPSLEQHLDSIVGNNHQKNHFLHLFNSQSEHRDAEKKKGSSFDEPNSVTNSNDGGTYPSRLVSHQLNSIVDGINSKGHSLSQEQKSRLLLKLTATDRRFFIASK